MPSSRAQVLDFLAAGPAFTVELMAELGVSRDTLRRMAADKAIVNLAGAKSGRGNEGLWATVGWLRRALREAGL